MTVPAIDNTPPTHSLCNTAGNTRSFKVRSDDDDACPFLWSSTFTVCIHVAMYSNQAPTIAGRSPFFRNGTTVLARVGDKRCTLDADGKSRTNDIVTPPAI